MILFIAAWHLVDVLGLIGGILGSVAFVAVARLWALWWGIGTEIEQAHDRQAEQQRQRRSAAARKGHETRRARTASTNAVLLDFSDEDQVERVLRQIDAQARAKQGD